MADQIKYLIYRLTNMAEAGPLAFDAETIREAIAALSAREGGGRHAEAGAVATAWIEPYHLGALRKRRENKEAGYILVEVCDSETEDYCVPLYTRPAQPASQQEESRAITALKVTLFEVECYLPSSIAKKVQAVCETHPTGDRVRGLVSQLREAITDWGDNMRNETLADLLAKTDRIAAALDQEKGR